MELRCTDYSIERKAGEPVTVFARYILLVSEHDSEKIAKAMSQIELLFSNSISLIKYTGFRCVWCGTKQDEDTATCSQCGGLL